MTTPGASGSTCPFCGAPVAASGARTCATCGHDLSGSASPSPNAGVNGWRIISIAVGFAAITGTIAYLLQFPQIGVSLPGFGYFHDVGFYAAAAYVYAMLRLSRARWWRVALEAVVTLLVATVLNLLAFGSPTPLPDLMGVLVSSFMLFLLGSLIVGALLGTAVASWSASWRVLRPRASPAGAWLFIAQAASVIIGFFALWQIGLSIGSFGPFIVQYIFHVDMNIETALLLNSIGQYVFALGPAIAILVVAIVQALRLRSVGAPAT